MNKEELLDHLAIEILRLAPHSFVKAYDLAEEMVERRQQILDRWVLRDEIVEGVVGRLELTVRSENCLKDAGVLTIKQLQALTENDLLRLPNLGRKSLNEIKEQMQAFGCRLKEKS